jgi:hypothetical protein
MTHAEIRELLVVLLLAGGSLLLLAGALSLLNAGVAFARERIRHVLRRRFYRREIDHCTERLGELNEDGDFHTVEYGELGKRLERALKFFAQGQGDPH